MLFVYTVLETFRSFLGEEFDAKSYAASIVQGSSVAQNLSKLADGISLLDKEIHAQVVAHHNDLLSQATGIETLEGWLNDIVIAIKLTL